MDTFLFDKGTRAAEMWRRKSKGRSRLGCISCRQRRIKCDESRPRCSRCTKHSLSCRYGCLDPAKEWQRSIVTFKTSAASSSKSIISDIETDSVSKANEAAMARTERLRAPVVFHRAPSITCDGFGNRQSQLLEHFISAASYDILGSREAWVHEGLQLAAQNDFLMHTILMISASHLQHSKPALYKTYNFHAICHLQRSLRSFRAALNENFMSCSKTDAIIGTAFLLIIQGYSNPNFRCESASSESDSLLYHSSGIFDIVRKTYEHAMNGMFQSTCTPKLLPSTFPTSGPAFNLFLMVNAQGLDSGHAETDIKIYVAVIESLTLVLEATTSSPSLRNTPADSLLVYLVRWLSFLPPEFVVLVNERNEKALIIMAYYYAAVAFVLSKARGGWWWMRRRPLYMVTHIAAFLNNKWEMWMRWPVEMIEKCQELTSKSMTRSNHHDYSLDPTDDNTNAEAELGILSNLQLHYGKIRVQDSERFSGKLSLPSVL